MTKLSAFLLCAAVGAVLCAFGMLVSYDFFTSSNRRTPYSYSQFLLENIDAPRIVIDAGSSAMFGIEPGLIEKTFEMPVIDVADNGAIDRHMMPVELESPRLVR